MNDEGIIRIADFLKANDDYCIIMHISPDGDTIGSGLALYSALLLLNKKVSAVCQDKIPEVYRFLPYSSSVQRAEIASNSRTVIAVDCADIERLGAAKPLFEAAEHTISIDHHPTNTLYAEHNEVHGKSASAGEIIFKLIFQLLGSIPSDIAKCLYTAVMTDTGNFSYGNTSKDSFLTAAELIGFGASPSDLNKRIYRTNRLSKTRLLGFALSSMSVYEEESIAVAVVTSDDLKRFNAEAEDTEGIVDTLRDIETVEIAIFMRECKDGSYKVSMRSTDNCNIAELAKSFGGGGHLHAAGFKSDVPFDELFDMLLAAAKEIVNAI